MKIEWNTSEYESNHGAAPRGRGSWAFEDESGRGPEFSPGGLTYTQAKAWFRGVLLGRYAPSTSLYLRVKVCS